MLSHIREDIRYAVRLLARNRTFAIVAIGILALGIGVTSAIFSVADAVLLRPLPYPQPSRLFLISGATASQGSQLPLSYPNITYLQGHAHSFSGLAAFAEETFNLTGRGDPQQLAAARVSSNFFDVLAIRPALGRAFLPEEDRPGGGDVVVISHALWRSRFGASPDAIGQAITLDSRPSIVIGVLPPGFVFPLLGRNIDIWAPRLFDINIGTPQWVAAGAGFVNAVACLRDGVEQRRAQAEVDALYARYRAENPGRPDTSPQARIDVSGLQEQAGAKLRPALIVLLSASGFLLLIACVNVANLLLSRALVRRREIAIRSALGAGRGAVIRQLLTESVLLAVLGGCAGLLLARWGTRVMSAVAMKASLAAPAVTLDMRAALFALAISLASGILFGLVPVLQLSGAGLSAILHDSGRGHTGGRGAARARSLLVILQAGLSLVLLVSAGMLIHSFIRLRSAAPGFDPTGVLTMKVTLPPAKYPKAPEMLAFYRQMLEGLRTLPGVNAAAVSSALPLNAARLTPMLMEGQPAVPLSERPILHLQMISPEYAAVFRVPLLRGREFNDHDDESSTRVALINEALARRYWSGQDPVGKRIWLGRSAKPVEVVGVLASTRNQSLESAPQPEVVVPFPQLPWAWLNISLRTSGDPRSIIGAARQRIAAVDKDQPVTGVQTLEEVLEAASAQPRFTMLLVSIFSAMALIFAAVGIYGVLACSVAQRTQELGVRVALGATRADVLRLVIGDGLRLTAGGIVLGTAASLLLTPLLVRLLYVTEARDPAAFAVGIATFLLVAVLAAYLPARRALRVDPAETLRAE